MSYFECFSVTVSTTYSFNPKLRLFLCEIGYCCTLMETRTSAHSWVDPHTIDSLFFVFPCKINKSLKSYEYQLPRRCLEGRLEGFKDSSWILKIMKLVEYRIAKKCHKRTNTFFFLLFIKDKPLSLCQPAGLRHVHITPVSFSCWLKLTVIVWTAMAKNWLKHVVHTHRTSCRSGWLRGFDFLNPKPHSRHLSYLFKPVHTATKCSTQPIRYATLHSRDRQGAGSRWNHHSYV